MIGRSRHAALLVGVALPAALTAQTVPPEKAFGARESVISASLSPGGTRFSFLAPAEGQGNALYTAPVDGTSPPARVLVASGKPERLRYCGWVSESRLVCDVYIVRDGGLGAVGSSRMIAADYNGANVRIVTRRQGQDALYVNQYGGSIIDWLPGQDGQIMLDNWFVPEARIGTLVEKKGEGLGVERVDTLTGNRKVALRPFRTAAEFITDGTGNIRISGTRDTVAEGYSTGKTMYRYRTREGGEWQPLSTYDQTTREGFNPYAVDPEKNVAYGFQKLDGRRALYLRTLDGTLREQLVLSRPDVDVDGLIRLGRRNRVIGATYATDKRVAAYFDPTFVELRTRLAKAIPGAGLINFEGASDDENKLLLWAGSDVDPGKYYLFDRQTKQLRPLIMSRPELDGITLASVKPISIKAADGTDIPGYLTLPPGSTGKGLPAIVMPHGGPGSRDEWGFDWLVQYFAHQGYAVLQPNFRGSTGYGEAWFQKNGFQSWRIAIGDVTDSGSWLVSQGIADPKKLAIFGWSYGGYAALQSGVVAPDLFKAIVAVAPVTDLDDLREQYRDTTEQRTIRDFVGTGKHIVEGSPDRNASRITAPVLMFHGTLDRNVRYRASQLMDDALKNAGKPHQLITYDKLDHQLDDSAARADMLKRSDDFIKAAFAK
jgi:dipeptidyl aminopeptidase/acylaminoacyl peptidase